MSMKIYILISAFSNVIFCIQILYIPKTAKILKQVGSFGIELLHS